MNKLFSKLMIAVVALTFVSCASEEIPASAYSDAFILTKKIGGVERHGIALHSYSNKTLKSVTAESEAGDTYMLSAVNNFSMEFYYEDDILDFTAEVPEAGTYTFTVVPTSGEAMIVENVLYGTALTPVDFTTCEYDVDNSRINIEWELEDDIDYSVVRLLDADGVVVYFSDVLSSTTESARITSSNWVGGYYPGNGETYTVELNIFLREGESTHALESKAISTETVVWGE